MSRTVFGDAVGCNIVWDGLLKSACFTVRKVSYPLWIRYPPNRELTDDDVQRVAATYHVWREDKDAAVRHIAVLEKYQDVAGFARALRWPILLPTALCGSRGAMWARMQWRTMAGVTAQFEAQFVEGAKLEESIRRNLQAVQFGAK